MLEEHGYRVVPAASGAHAIELSLRERPDVVLLDLLMPGEDGWETAAALREHPETAGIPIVAVTVLPPEDAIRDGDLDDYVQKPLDEAKLAAALDRALLRASGCETALVVEDDLDLGRILCATLEGFGLRCEHARDGNEAIECAGRLRPQIVLLDLGLPGPKVTEAGSGADALVAAAAERPDAILLDVMMPGLDGPSTFARLQEGEATRDIPVIMLTAKVQATDRTRLAELGVAAVLSKPFDPMTLADDVASVLGWR